MLLKFLERFRKSDDGAVTVDWVVMTAVVIGLALGCIYILNDGTTNVGSTLNGELGKVAERVKTRSVIP